MVLLGRHGRHDTTQAPQSVTDARRHWITRYLNGRFLRFPAQVEVLVGEHHGRDTQLQRRSTVSNITSRTTPSRQDQWS